MTDAPLRLTDPDLRARSARALGAEDRIATAVASLGPVADRDVVCIEEPGADGAARLLGLGAWVRVVPPGAVASLPDQRADVIVSWWSGYRPGSPTFQAQVADAVRILRPDGRLLVIHDYARDDVAHLADPERAAELIAWSRPKGPLLGAGFRIRVLHCWWQWDSLEDAAAFLADAYGDTGVAVAAALRRPRLAYKVAVYHADRPTLSGMLAGPAVPPVDADAGATSETTGPDGTRHASIAAQPTETPAPGSTATPHGGMVFA